MQEESVPIASHFSQPFTVPGRKIWDNAKCQTELVMQVGQTCQGWSGASEVRSLSDLWAL